MKHKTVKKVEQEVVERITCDCCGRECNTDLGGEYMDLEAVWGFYSNKDLQIWKAQLCEECVDEKLGFINFQKTNAISGKIIKNG